MTTREKTNLISKIALPLVVALFCALVPLGMHNSGHLQWSEAYADEPYDAEQFLELAARQSDLTGSQLVSTVGEVVTVTTGIPVSTNGLSPRATLAGNIGSLIDAADYPAWDTLTEQQKTDWGTKENYDTAKFNSMMRGLGLGEDLDNFKGSAGGSFTFSDAAKKRLEQIGRIGSLWANGAGIAISQVFDLVTNREQVIDWFVAPPSGGVVDCTDSDVWVSGVQRVLTFYDFLHYRRSGYYVTAAANSAAAIFVPFNGKIFVCSKTAYSYGTSSNTSQYKPVTNYVFPAEEGTYNGKTVYCNLLSQDGAVYDGATPNGNIGSLGTNDKRKLAYAILYEGKIPSGEHEKIPDYPEEPEQTGDRVYMPQDGIGGSGTTYNVYITNPGTVPERPENPYNPGDQTGGNQWAGETTANVLPLAQLPFDKLFPFCLLYDLPLLLHKILDVSGVDTGGGLRAQAVPDYEKIVLDWPNPGGAEPVKFEIDLKWLRELLTLVRPALQVLLLFGFLWASIQFWKGVITG